MANITGKPASCVRDALVKVLRESGSFTINKTNNRDGTTRVCIYFSKADSKKLNTALAACSTLSSQSNWPPSVVTIVSPP